MKTLKRILDTEQARVDLTDRGYVLMIRLQREGKEQQPAEWVVQQPYTPDLRGMIGALTLAIDVLAGKVWPVGVVRDDKRSSEDSAKLLKSQQVHIIDDRSQKNGTGGSS